MVIPIQRLSESMEPGLQWTGRHASQMDSVQMYARSTSLDGSSEEMARAVQVMMSRSNRVQEQWQQFRTDKINPIQGSRLHLLHGLRNGLSHTCDKNHSKVAIFLSEEFECFCLKKAGLISASVLLEPECLL